MLTGACQHPEPYSFRDRRMSPNPGEGNPGMGPLRCLPLFTQGDKFKSGQSINTDKFAADILRPVIAELMPIDDEQTPLEK
jgi:hypothetical protein